MAKADPRDFLLNTDYEMDKVIYFKEGYFTNELDIPHDLNFIPLPFGVWSTDKDFSSVNMIGWKDTDQSAYGGPTPELSVDCYATPEKFHLSAAGNSNNVPLFYRLYAFEPPDSSSNTPHTSKSADNFILNTDYNYLKLFKAGMFTRDNEQYVHGLGYIPQAMGWWVLSPDIFGERRTYTVGSEQMQITDNAIKCGNMLLNIGFAEKVYWRIYYDES